MQTRWTGVFPAVTTQFRQDESLDLDSTARHIEVLLANGVSGIVLLGSLGENTALTPDEKRQVIAMTMTTVAGRVPILSGVAESGTALAMQYARDMEKTGVNGLMLMPPMVYKPDARETLAYYRTVAHACGLPILVYNNPIAYTADITPEMFAELADDPQFVAIKESSGNVRRITDIINLLGDRYTLFAGVDDLLLESVLLGAKGWIAGTGIAFPQENQRLWNLAASGQWDAAREIYRWFTPLLHLDIPVKFVQYIKLAMQETGLGSEWVRAPRLPLVGEERERILGIIRQGIATRPTA